MIPQLTDEAYSNPGRTRKRRFRQLHLLGCCLLTLALFQSMTSPGVVAASEKAVRAVVFFKQDCPACKEMLYEVLPVFKKQYGDRLEILVVDNGNPKGGNLYLGALFELNIPMTQPLPFLIIGDRVLGGVENVRLDMPGLIEKILPGGGNDWPPITGLDETLDYIEGLPPGDQASWWITGDISEIDILISGFVFKYNRDPRANRYAVAVLVCLLVSLVMSAYLFFGDHQGRLPFVYRGGVFLLLLVGVFVGWHLAEIDSILVSRTTFPGSFEDLLALTIFAGMIFSLVFSVRAFPGSNRKRIESWQMLIVPVLTLIIVIAAGYLFYSEMSGAEAQCGAVGDCNAVQQSPYARLFGWISVAGFGITGIAVVTLFWLLHKFGPEKWRSLFGVGVWCALLIGVLFFTYLTFLEPFVIGATCFWCLSASIAMVTEFYVLSPIAGQAWRELKV